MKNLNLIPTPNPTSNLNPNTPGGLPQEALRFRQARQEVWPAARPGLRLWLERPLPDQPLHVRPSAVDGQEPRRLRAAVLGQVRGIAISRVTSTISPSLIFRRWIHK